MKQFVSLCSSGRAAPLARISAVWLIAITTWQRGPHCSVFKTVWKNVLRCVENEWKKCGWQQARIWGACPTCAQCTLRKRAVLKIEKSVSYRRSFICDGLSQTNKCIGNTVLFVIVRCTVLSACVELWFKREVACLSISISSSIIATDTTDYCLLSQSWENDL